VQLIKVTLYPVSKEREQ